MSNLSQRVIQGLSEQIHTNVPTISRKHLDSKLFGYLLDSNNTYRSAIKSLKDAKAIILKDSTKFGAVVYLGFGRNEDGKYDPSTEVQLTKKKESWRNLVFTLFGDVRDETKIKKLKSELMKHGLVIIKD